MRRNVIRQLYLVFTGVDIFPFTPDPKSRNEMYLFQKVRKQIAEPTVAQADLGGSKTMM